MSFTLEILPNTRKFFKEYLDTISLEDLNKIPEGFNNNIIWNIGHIVVTQQLLCYKLSGLPMMVSDELIAKFCKGSKPDGHSSKEEVETIKGLLFSTLEQLKEDFNNGIFKTYNAYTVSTTGNTLHTIDEALQFVSFHEGMHYGYVMALIRAINS